MANLTLVEHVRQILNISKSTHETDVGFIMDVLKDNFPALIEWDNTKAFESLRHTVYEERRKLAPGYTPKTKGKSAHPSSAGADWSLTPEVAGDLLIRLNDLTEKFPSPDEFTEVVQEVSDLLTICGGSVETLHMWSKLVIARRIQA